MRNGEHVAAAVVDGLEQTVGGDAPMDEIADRAGHRRPIDRDLAAPAPGADVLRRRDRDRRRRSIAFSLAAGRREPGDPRGAGRALSGLRRRVPPGPEVSLPGWRRLPRQSARGPVFRHRRGSLYG